MSTQQGPLDGFPLRDDPVTAWLGIPYAAPPVGALRWKPPLDAPTRAEPLPATAYGADCYQGTAGSSEDCLTLNVWRPSSGGKWLPVFVFIHGGSNTSGSAAGSWYTVAQHYHVVVVTTNYRLGAMGWFLHPALLSGDPAADSGNFGTLDQIKALAWVNRNIAKFGGDPTNITLAGESAGSHDVSYLLHSRLAKDYFQKAIIESNFPGIRPVSAAYKSSKQVLYDLLVTDGIAPNAAAAKRYVETQMSASDIRQYFYSKSAADITNEYSNVWWGSINWGDFYRDDISAGDNLTPPPMVQSSQDRPEFVYAIGDGYVLPSGISFANFMQGYVYPKPLMVGTNTNEHDAWNAYWPLNFQAGKSLDTLVTEAVDGSDPSYGTLQNLYNLVSDGDPTTFKRNYKATTALTDEVDTFLAVAMPARNLAHNPDADGLPVYA